MEADTFGREEDGRLSELGGGYRAEGGKVSWLIAEIDGASSVAASSHFKSRQIRDYMTQASSPSAARVESQMPFILRHLIYPHIMAIFGCQMSSHLNEADQTQYTAWRNLCHMRRREMRVYVGWVIALEQWKSTHSKYTALEGKGGW